MRLFHLVGMKCQELEDDWELRHCIRNRANVIAYAGDLPALLQGAGALKSDQTESEQPKAQQTVIFNNERNYGKLLIEQFYQLFFVLCRWS